MNPKDASLNSTPTSKHGTIGITTMIALVLIILTLAVYWQVGTHQFLNFDDNEYVTDNPHIAGGLTGNNIRWAFTSEYAANWHPITWLSHMADVQLYGMEPRGHHLTNVALHTVSTVLLFLVLLRLTGAIWPGAFVAALFALHPLHVESVAWVAERKDLLCAFFWFLTLYLYTGYVEKRKPALYGAALVTFVLGLMSKPMLVSLPLIMLVIDYWPLDRFRHEGRATRIMIEKIPFAVCSLLSALVTIYAQGKGGAIAGFSIVPFGLRCKNALVAYVSYIGKTIYPHDLAVYYPFPSSIPLWQAIGSAGILAAISFLVIRIRNRHPYLVTGWLWFIITLLPVIGLMQVGGQSMADRYTYIPVIGLFIMVAWGVPALAAGLRYRTSICTLLAGAVIIASTMATWRQLGYWWNNISLYQRTLSVTTDNATIHNNLGIALLSNGYVTAAIQEYQTALRINPNHVNAHYNLGHAFQQKGYLTAAIQEYEITLRMTPNDPDAHSNLGLALSNKGNPEAAIREFQEALRIKPDHANAHNGLGAALAMKGDLVAAIPEFQNALRINPKNTNARTNLERALAQKGVR